MLEYKLKMYGIRLEKQKESYSSQCSPVSPEVSKKYAEPSNRKKRGLYVAGKKETAVRNRTETAPNNKSSCVAKKQAVVVAWTHPENAVSRFDSDALVICCRVVHYDKV